MSDKVLVLMPASLEYFLPAVAVVHNYILQLRRQAVMGLKPNGIEMVIDVATEANLFFDILFPQLGLPKISIVVGGQPMDRSCWNCVLDFRDIKRAMALIRDNRKPLVEGWNILFGCSAKPTPNLGYLGTQIHQEAWDILIDESCGYAEFFGSIRYADIKIASLNSLRPANVFRMLAKSRMYVGPTSGASMMVATMGKPQLELLSDIDSLWLFPKVNRRAISKSASRVLVTAAAEEMWSGISNTKSQEEILAVSFPSTVEVVGVK